jgi:hypothetical protein
MVMKTVSAKSRWRRWHRGTWRRPVSRVKEEGKGVMLGGRSDTRRHRGFGGFILKTIGRGRVWSTLLASGLVVWTSKPLVAGLWVWASKPERRFQGGTDGTWRHRGVRFEAKLGLKGLAHVYQGQNWDYVADCPRLAVCAVAIRFSPVRFPI